MEVGQLIKGKMKIAHRNIGPGFVPLVIAELGINHEGSLNTAFEMVDAAAAAGAEVLKHQTHIVEDEMSGEARNVVPGNADVSIYEIMRRCALNEDEEIELMKYVQSKGMIFISTPFSRAAANRLEKMEVDAYKIGSGECNNYPLIEHIANFQKPMIVSTGMNDIDSIKKTVDIMVYKEVDFALLHTTNIYPTPNHLVRLHAVREMMDAFPGVIVGLSDHTLSNHACFGAVALGCSIVERHFTDHMGREGPDIVCSMDQAKLKELIDGVEILFQQRHGGKHAVQEEKPTIDFAFASVVSIKNINVGEELTESNIWVKRPGTGFFSANDYKSILGRKASRFIAADKQLDSDDIVVD